MAIERVFVCGAGLMGHGIAQVHAAAGHRVTLYEPDLARAEAGRERIAGNLERAVAKGKLDRRERDATLARIDADGRPRRRRADADLVVEAVFEDVAVKHGLWRELDGVAPAAAIFAINTQLDLDRPARGGGLGGAPRRGSSGMHFFSPVPVMPLIELIRGARHRRRDRGGDPRARRPSSASRSSSSADRPGFIVNRILMPFLAEAMRAYEEGLGHRRGHRHRRAGRPQPPDGPARAGRLHRPRRLPRHHAGAPRRLRRASTFAPPRVLVELVDAGHLGQKTGRGFYTYPRRTPPIDAGGRSTEEERLLQATAREFATREVAPRRDRARRGRALRPLAVRRAMGELGLTAAPLPGVGRRCRVLVPRAGRWSWRSSAPPTWRWPCRCPSTSCRSTRS